MHKLQDAMHMMKQVWGKVSNATISNYWIKGGFSSEEQTKNKTVDILPQTMGLTAEQFDKWMMVLGLLKNIPKNS